MPQDIDDLPAAEEYLVSFNRSIPVKVEDMLHKAVHTSHFERITHCDVYISNITRQACEQGDNKVLVDKYYCRMVSVFRRQCG